MTSFILIIVLQDRLIANSSKHSVKQGYALFTLLLLFSFLCDIILLLGNRQVIVKRSE